MKNQVLFSLKDKSKKLKVGSFSFECIIVFANLFYKLSESTFYKEMSKFSQKVHS